MSYVREHDLASSHPITLAGEKAAERAVKRAMKADERRAAKLRVKAEALLSEASDLEDKVRRERYYSYDSPYKAMREEIQDAAYWKAREAIGTLPRDENGDYVDPAPMWKAYYKGEFLGEFQGEERTDVLRIVCPQDDPRRWGDFDVEKSK